MIDIPMFLCRSKVKSFTRKLPYLTKIAEIPITPYWQWKNLKYHSKSHWHHVGLTSKCWRSRITDNTN